MTKLPNYKFGDDWYSAEYQAKEADETVNGGAEKFTVYTDKNGKYIDADYNLGKIRVKLSSGSTADLINTSDDDEGVRASVSDAKVIGQDSNSIYRLAKITIKSTKSGVSIKTVNGVELSDTTDSFTQNTDKTVEFGDIEYNPGIFTSPNINTLTLLSLVTVTSTLKSLYFLIPLSFIAYSSSSTFFPLALNIPISGITIFPEGGIFTLSKPLFPP